MRRLLLGLLVLLGLLTPGCASLFNLPERLPERLEGKGLLVAHVSAVGLSVRQYPVWSDPLIDGRARVYLPGERTVVHDRQLHVANWVPGVMGGRPLDVFGARVASGRDGYYVYATVGDRAAFFSRYGTGVYEPLALPDDIQLDGLEERAGALYAWTAVTYWTSKSRAPLFVRAAGAANWERRVLPGPRCSLRFLDESGARIVGVCSTGRFESSDGGRSWRSL